VGFVGPKPKVTEPVRYIDQVTLQQSIRHRPPGFVRVRQRDTQRLRAELAYDPSGIVNNVVRKESASQRLVDQLERLVVSSLGDQEPGVRNEHDE
jgi:hypothetical protein